MALTAQEIETLRALEENLWRTEFRFDRAWMDSILAEDFVEFGRSGTRYTRQECLDVEAETIDATLPLPQFEARLIAPDVAQVTYVSSVTGKRSNRSSLWLRTTSGWKLKFHQGTAIP